MSNVKPADVVEEAIVSGKTKATAPSGALVLRGVLGGAVLGATTSFAVSAGVSSGSPVVGALLFPAGITIVILMGMELVTGGFALTPMAALRGLVPWSAVGRYCLMVIIGHIIGALAFALLYAAVLTGFGSHDAGALGQKFIDTAQAKTTAYQALGLAGMGTVFVKAMLCNWLVCLGVVMGMVSKDTIGKIAAIWLPIMAFFGLGFEHAVVNFFMIPMGMLLGADVSLGDWWFWNQIPVLLGNFVGGFVFTGLALMYAHRPARAPHDDAAPAARTTGSTAGTEH
ncbi:formate/nitrite transporter family protein [Kocuria tytonis]|uniref:Formate/nitrite transporter family protein n=1 Tax=Kocuria tytonis TaxID=2054280 RepID=A0A495A2Q9_9MICC|nr:formate/nitrite transporter family protein [Kocuria tytonis]RKQ33738.1 formate/nitrite transporter family protein [Kocuria tytonis]